VVEYGRIFKVANLCEVVTDIFFVIVLNASTELDQGHLRPPPEMKIGPPFAKFSKA